MDGYLRETSDPTNQTEPQHHKLQLEDEKVSEIRVRLTCGGDAIDQKEEQEESHYIEDMLSNRCGGCCMKRFCSSVHLSFVHESIGTFLFFFSSQRDSSL